ncbi:MAG TPA: hypothetical protein PLL76_23550 [Thermoanaerobaculia bacterium]|nr:hypothetical protein [Thermoanaerobaculia bacterium]
MPFLTDIDSRAAIKGSRDPLGAQAIWTLLGRRVVGGLTTNTTSVRDFVVLLLGYWFIEKLDEAGSREEALPAFIRWEQLASYARFQAGDTAFRGTSRTKAFLSEEKAVTVSAQPAYQILANQKIYGLWGLYSQSARASGLLDEKESRLTPAARDLADRVYRDLLGRETVGRIVELLGKRESRIRPENGDEKLLGAVAKALGVKRRRADLETTTFRETLAWGGPGDPMRTKGLQKQLAGVVLEFGGDPRAGVDGTDVQALAKVAGGKGHGELRHRLEEILAAESVIAPATAAFQYALSQGGRELSAVVEEIRREWGGALKKRVRAAEFEALKDDVQKALRDSKTTGIWLEAARRMGEGDVAGLVETLVELNRDVMWKRDKASPWVQVTNGKLDVHFADERAKLPSAEQLAAYWVSPYFLGALRAIALELGGE